MRKIIIIWVFTLIVLVTNVEGIVTKEIVINVTETKPLELLYIPLDNPKQLYSNTVRFNQFLGKVYPLSNNGLISSIAPYAMSSETIL